MNVSNHDTYMCTHTRATGHISVHISTNVCIHKFTRRQLRAKFGLIHRRVVYRQMTTLTVMMVMAQSLQYITLLVKMQFAQMENYANCGEPVIYLLHPRNTHSGIHLPHLLYVHLYVSVSICFGRRSFAKILNSICKGRAVGRFLLGCSFACLNFYLAAMQSKFLPLNFY